MGYDYKVSDVYDLIMKIKIYPLTLPKITRSFP